MEQKTDSMEFLLEAKTALAELEKQKTYRSGLAREEKRQERPLEAEKDAAQHDASPTTPQPTAATTGQRKTAQASSEKRAC